MTASKKPLRIVLDTDPGVDDLLTILMLLQSPDVEVVGITTVFGNASVDQCTYNTQRILSAAGREEVPIFKGAGRPLNGDDPRLGLIVHGEDGLGSATPTPDEQLSAPMPSLQEEPAAEALHRLCVSDPGEVTILAIGPLTNVAAALTATPDVAFMARDVVIMGGNALCPGNRTPAAEANIMSDPEAAEAVFAVGWNLTMVGLDVTNTITFSTDQLESVVKTSTSGQEILAAALPHYLHFNRTVSGRNEIKLHDPAAAAYLLEPDLFQIEEWPVAVDTSSGIGRGKTWPCVGNADFAGPPWADRRPVKVCTSADASAVADLTHALLTNKP